MRITINSYFGYRATDGKTIFPRRSIYPIHKGIRSMIYGLGAKLQRTDFTDASATEAIVKQLKHNLLSANSSCIICMLHEHAGHEEENIFPQIEPYDSELVDKLDAGPR